MSGGKHHRFGSAIPPLPGPLLRGTVGGASVWAVSTNTPRRRQCKRTRWREVTFPWAPATTGTTPQNIAFDTGDANRAAPPITANVALGKRTSARQLANARHS